VGGGQGGVGGLQMSFGIGAFPFGFFTNFNVGGENRGGGHAHMGTPQWEEEQIVHKFFLYVAMAFIFWLLVA
jgi:E3 ubiquitin-protein ligase RNF5